MGGSQVQYVYEGEMNWERGKGGRGQGARTPL